MSKAQRKGGRVGMAREERKPWGPGVVVRGGHAGYKRMHRWGRNVCEVEQPGSLG